VTAVAPCADIECRLVTAMRQQLGTEVCGRLDDPQVIEVMLNPDGAIWEDRLGAGMAQIGTMAPVKAECFDSTSGSTLRASVMREHPILESELPIGGAFEAMIPPVVSAPRFTIRLKAVRVFTVDDHVPAGIMTSPQRVAIREAVASRRNILFCGGSASGMLRAAIAAMDTFASTAVPTSGIAHAGDVAQDFRTSACHGNRAAERTTPAHQTGAAAA
jgi:type IV secretion system protein TrbB